MRSRRHRSCSARRGTAAALASSGAIAPYFAFLGEAWLRALTIDDVDTIPSTFGVRAPAAPDVGNPWGVDAEQYPELHPALVEEDGVLGYVMHYVQAEPPSEGPGGGSRVGGPLALQRWTIQLVPLSPAVDWKREAIVRP